MDIEVRGICDADAGAVEEVTRLATGDLRKVYRPAASASSMTPIPTTQLVAMIGDRIAGTVRYSVGANALHIIGLMVHPSFRRRGVAGALIEAVADIARERGVAALSLYTIRQTGNVEIFSRLGFSVAEEQPAEGVESIDGRPLTDVLMTRPA